MSPNGAYLVLGREPAAVAYRARYRWLDFALDRTAYRELTAQATITRSAWLTTLAAPKGVRPVRAERPRAVAARIRSPRSAPSRIRYRLDRNGG
jgi:hypothetical protein